MKFRPLLGAVAAAAMLAAGCDYWRNLVDDRTVATAHLKVKVRDNFTLETLVATCTDSSRGMTLITAAGSGQADTLGAGTGMYTMRCHANWGYYDKVIGFPLTPAGDTVIFGLARMGEGEWYKGEPLREVRIRERFDTLRFPGDFDFHAYPEDTTGLNRFRYIWTFARAKGLDLDSTNGNGKFPAFHMEPGLANVVPGPDTLTLRVWSMLRKDEEFYYVGMDKRPFVWKRNQLPRLVLGYVDTARQYSVSCPGISLPLRMNFRGEDPDGNATCKSVRFFTESAASAFGSVDTTLPCFEQKIDFELRNALDSLRSDSAFLRFNTLNITVTDDMGARFDSSIVIKTRTNILPTVTSSIIGTPTSAFTGDSVKVHYNVSDLDGIPQSVIISWAGVDGETRVDYRSKSANSLSDTVFWIYRTPGLQSINVTVMDICGKSAKSFTGDILIRDNRDPEATFKYFRDVATMDNHLYYFRLTVEDKDIEQNLDDRITEVYVNWGDGEPFQDFPNIGSIYDKTLTHQFTRPPDSLGRYRITIDVHDAHRGVDTLEVFFQVP